MCPVDFRPWGTLLLRRGLVSPQTPTAAPRHLPNCVGEENAPSSTSLLAGGAPPKAVRGRVTDRRHPTPDKKQPRNLSVAGLKESAMTYFPA